MAETPEESVASYSNKETQRWAELYLREKGWNRADVSRALGYNDGGGLHQAFENSEAGLSPDRWKRLQAIVELFEEGGKMAPPKRPLPLNVALPARNGAAPEAPPPAATNGLGLLDALARATGDVGSAERRIRAQLVTAKPLVRVGLERALEMATELRKLLEVE